MKIFKVLLVSALLGTAPANAATYVITYTGTVTGTDNSGIFGSIGDLRGDFTAVYTLHYPLSGTQVYEGAGFREVYGGTYYDAGGVSPLNAVLTINGVSQAFSGNYFGWVAQLDQYYGIEDEVVHQVRMSSDELIYNGISSTIHNIVDSLDITEPVDYSVQDGDNYISNFRTTGAFGNLYNRRVTIVAAPSVPEPSAWVMMIMGFGMLSAAMRWPRQTLRSRMSFLRGC